MKQTCSFEWNQIWILVILSWPTASCFEFSPFCVPFIISSSPLDLPLPYISFPVVRVDSYLLTSVCAARTLQSMLTFFILEDDFHLERTALRLHGGGLGPARQ